MNTRTWILSGVLLVAPLPGWSAEPAPATVPGKPVFNLKSERVQELVRSVAKSQDDSNARAAVENAPEVSQPFVLRGQTTIPFRAPIRPHHVKCDNFDCIAYSADEVALYSVPRSQYYGDRLDGNNKMDGWLSCQSRDNLLTTFERYDKCRGVTVGLPLTFGNTVIGAPGLRF
jgi:hypothetical protein